MPFSFKREIVLEEKKKKRKQPAALGGTTVWFERLVEKAGIRYQLFFALVGCLLYGGGVTLAGMTGNLSEFITERKWACFIALLAATGVALFYTLRKFDSSVDRLNEVVELSEDKLSEEKRRLRGSITVPVYWIPVVLLLAWYLSRLSIVGGGLVDWGGYHYNWVWWATYNSPHLFNVYYVVMCLPWFLVSAIYLCVVAVGLNLAYARLCLRTRFRGRELLTRGTRVFNGFGRLTIVTFACLVVASLSYVYLWHPLKADLWTSSVHLPIGAIYLPAMALPAALLPHYFFYRLLSRTKAAELNWLESEMRAVSRDPGISQRKREQRLRQLGQDRIIVESARTSLLNVRIVVEFVGVSVAHLGLMQLVPHL